MSKLFPESIRKIGLFPLSLGNQGDIFFQTALKRLDDMGVEYVIRLPEGGEYRYLAGTDQARAESLNRLLEDDSIDLLFAIRGGVGAVRTLPYINWDLLMKRDIPVVGFSDMTGFLLPAWGKGFKKSILGKMAESTFGDTKLTQEQVAQCAQALYHCVSGKVVSPPYPQTLTAVKAGRATAPVVPCNLMLLISLLGTPWMPDLTSTILVIESIGQNIHQIERNLTQLEQAGILGKLKGMVYGTFTSCEQNQYLPELFRDYSTCIDGPVCSGLRFGHEEPSTVFQVGGMATLNVMENGEIIFE